MSATVPPRTAVLRLVVGAAVTTVVWCGLLPTLLGVRPVQEHIALMEDRCVDPSAMYYTELERLPLRPVWIDDVIVLWP